MAGGTSLGRLSHVSLACDIIVWWVLLVLVAEVRGIRSHEVVLMQHYVIFMHSHQA
jgi:hypothetical protein